MAMIEATSCGGVVIFRGKILLLYKNYRNRYEGWVLPKGTVESDEEYKDTAIREVKEETGASATIIQYVGKSHYSFTYTFKYFYVLKLKKVLFTFLLLKLWQIH